MSEVAADDPVAAFLRSPHAWAGLSSSAERAGRGGDVVLRRTHGATLGFAGDRVLKIKRPVDLGFFDFSTAARRRVACADEVRLNRRLAGTVYLGVLPIVETAGGLRAAAVVEPEAAPEPGAPVPVTVDGAATVAPVVDYAVVMERLPESGMLDRRLAAGPVPGEDLDRIAARLVRFHAEAARGPAIDAFARPAGVRRELAENFAQLEARIAAVPALAGQRGRVTLVRRALDVRIAAMQAELAERVAAGRPCEGHGDLHAGNLCLVGPGVDGVVAFDCIEFEPAFRCGDPARELGFLAMDLADRGAADAAERLLSAYAAASGDPDLPRLARPFAVHYAAVRAKVDSISAADAGVDAPARAAATASAGAFIARALAGAVGPAAIVLCGGPGSGKSRAGAAIARTLGATLVRSDVVRKRLFGVAPSDPVPEERRAEVYGAEATARTYAAVRETAAACLSRGGSVVLDATHGRRADRTASRAAIAGAGTWLLVHLDPPADRVRTWVRARAGDPENVSDADVAVAEAARARFEPPDEVPAAEQIRFDVIDDPDAAAAEVLGRLEQQLSARLADASAPA